MQKLKFTYLGQFSFQILLGIGILTLLSGFAIKFQDIEYGERLLFLFASPLLTIAIIAIWNNILNEAKVITLTKDTLHIKNFWTGKKREIPRTDLKGFRFNGWTHHFILINNQDETEVRIYEPFYRHLDDFIRQLNIEPIKNQKSFWKRIFG